MIKNENSFSSIVIDNGTESLKVGHAGDEAPRESIPTLVGCTKFSPLDMALDKPDYCVGQKALQRAGQLQLRRPIEGRRIVDFDGMEKLWKTAFYDVLRADPAQNAVLLTESCDYTPECKRKCAEIFFEFFGTPSLYMGNQGALALFSTGHTKGVVLDSGEGGTHVVPVYEGYVSPYAVGRTSASGASITSHLLRLLVQKGLTFSREYDFNTIKAIKEQKCYVSLDFEREGREFEENASGKSLTYSLPDGESLNLGRELIQAPELLFDPSLMGSGDLGVAELLYRSYFSIDTEVKNALFERIVLTGGNTLFPNVAERVSRSVRALGGSSINFKVFSPAERGSAAWIGGSILACLTPFESMWVSRQDYEEVGPNILNVKKI